MAIQLILYCVIYQQRASVGATFSSREAVFKTL